MILAARFSARKGLMPRATAERIAEHMADVGLPASLTGLGLACGGEGLVRHMLHDKKMDAGTLPFLLMKGIGKTYLDKQVALGEVAAFLDEEIGRAHV